MARALERISVAAIGNTVAELEADALGAEAAGIECVWAPELFRAADTQVAYLAAKTERIALGTGITWAFTRSPFVHAITALDLDEMSGGRFRLGLGSGVKRLTETWHNADYGKPAPHLREAIGATRLIMRPAGAGGAVPRAAGGAGTRSATRATTTTSTSRAGSVLIRPPVTPRRRSTPPRCRRG